MSGAPPPPPPRFAPDEPVAERLAAMVTVLATELAVVYERVDTLERLLAATGTLAPGAVEAFAPDAAAEAERRAWRQRFLERLFAGIAAEAEAAARVAPPEG
jgi:hypothetical protein